MILADLVGTRFDHLKGADVPQYYDFAAIYVYQIGRQEGGWEAFMRGRLSLAQGREWTRALIVDARASLRLTTDALLLEPESTDKWYRRVSPMIAIANIAAAMATGLTLTPDFATRSAIAAKLTRQADYLDGWRGQIEKGEAKLGKSASARSALYASAAWGTAQASLRATRIADLDSFERAVLGLTSHCDECVGRAAKGWRRIGTLAAIGDTQCLMLCDCHFEFK